MSEFLRDKLGVWLEDHADVSVSIVGVTTQAGRYFGQFYDIDNGVGEKAKASNHSTICGNHRILLYNHVVSLANLTKSCQDSTHQ